MSKLTHKMKVDKLVESVSGVPRQTFAQAKKQAHELELAVSEAEAFLRRIAGDEKGRMGLTPDHIRRKPEWQEAKRELDASFKRLQEFNVVFVKRFKKELAEERRERFSRKVGA